MPAKTPAQSESTEPATTSEANRDLQRTNKELQVRLLELEMQLSGGSQAESEPEDEGMESGEGASIISLIKDLHSQIDAAHELKEAMDADFASLKERFAKEQGVRSELEANVKLLEAKAALGEQLREDLAFVEEERTEIARRLEQTSGQLTKITEERDRLEEQVALDLKRVKGLESDKITLEANVQNLEETVADMGRLRQELAGARKELQQLTVNVQNLKGKLEAKETARNALEIELNTSREQVLNLNGQIEDLKESQAADRAQLAELRVKLDGESAQNANLFEANKRADHEQKALNARLEAVKKEVEVSKKALRDIRAAALHTTSRVRATGS